MAEGSRDQGGVGTTDPEEDSPNMIVYRKVSLTLCVCVCYSVWSICRKKHSLKAVTRKRAPDSPLVRINVYLPHARVSGSLSVSHLETKSSLSLSFSPSGPSS